jgi:phosphoglycerol transferase MdoB-like AlkP superfamily enzyme
MVSHGAFTNLAANLEAYGVMDFLLPFILVFTIVYAVMQRTKILGDNKNFNVIVALVLGLLFVVPHFTGTYPLGYDPVEVLNSALPSISLVAVAAIMLLMLLGIFGKRFSQTFAPAIAILSIGFVAYIFGASLNLWTGPYDAFSWWTPQTTELLIIILVFGLIVWFITKEPGSGNARQAAKGAVQGVGKWLENVGTNK